MLIATIMSFCCNNFVAKELSSCSDNSVQLAMLIV